MIGKNRGKTLPPRKKKTADSSPENSNPSHRYAETTATLDIIPRKVGSDLSFIRFADTIEESAVAVILQCKFPTSLIHFLPLS